MSRFDLPEINLIGEKLVEHWLNDNGYDTVSREALYMDKFSFVARGNIQQILVHVKTYLFPNQPVKTSGFENDLLCRRAEKLGVVPYLAYVIINTEGNLVEDIRWERLTIIEAKK